MEPNGTPTVVRQGCRAGDWKQGDGCGNSNSKRIGSADGLKRLGRQCQRAVSAAAAARDRKDGESLHCQRGDMAMSTTVARKRILIDDLGPES